MKFYANQRCYSYSKLSSYSWYVFKSTVNNYNEAGRGNSSGSECILKGWNGFDRRLFTCELLQALYI